MKTLRLITVALLVAFGVGCASGVNGIVDVNVNGAKVELAAATPSAFRMTVSYNGQIQPSQSVYLSPTPPAVPATTVHEDNWVGVHSEAGELLVDPSSGLWTMKNAQGKTIIPPSPLCESTTNQQTGKPFVLLFAGCNSNSPFEVYGCGDGADQLLQDHATPHLGNGHAVVPYFWSRAGYAALGVSQDDNDPPSWSSSEDLGRVTWIYAGNSADLYLMPAANLGAASKAFAQLSGPPVVAPRWTFGYLQSRWGWKDKAYIDDAMHQFLSRHLPIDAFIFDFEWYTTTPDYDVKAEGMPTFIDFSFNPSLFPDPANQIALMNANGIHFVGIRKPRLGNTVLLDMVRSKGWILPPGKSGENIDTRCLNYADPDVRHWYADQLVDLLKTGISGWWDDEGEITFTQYYWWNTSEAEALAKVHPDWRLWTIDRAFSPGNQRLGAAAWSGDIQATWAELAHTPTHLLNWSLAGMPYVACDIGGFGGETTGPLLTRWMEAGVFFPVMRSHSVVNVTPHFPWLFGPEAESDIRKALQLRYRLIPYYYSLAYEAHETGVPMMRPMAMEFPSDRRCANTSDQWFMGRELMAAPVLDATDHRRVYFPKDVWYAMDSNTPMPGNREIDVPAKLDQIPVYVRSGSILPLAPPIEHTDDLPGGPLEVQVYPGRDGHFTLVEDDGLTTAYLNGQSRHTEFSWDDESRTLSWTVTGPYAGKDIFTDINVSVMDASGVKRAQGSILADGSVVVNP